MSYLKERVSYLKGLAEGMQISDNTNEGKLLKSIIDVLDDFALAVEDLEELNDQIGEQIDSLDEGLADVEKVVFEDEDGDDEEEEFIEVECPHCHEEINLDMDLLEDNDSFECPNCHEKIDVEWDCDCGHEHHHEHHHE